MLNRSEFTHRPRSLRPLVMLGAVAFCTLGALAGPAVARAQTAPTAIQIEPQPVYQGCNSIVVISPTGTVWRDIVNRFSDPATVSAIWKYNNDLQRYQALYFADTDAVTDGPTTITAYIQSMFVCISADGSVG